MQRKRIVGASERFNCLHRAVGREYVEQAVVVDIEPGGAETCVATAEIISLGRTSGVARIDICNDGRAVCAAQGTVTVVAPKAIS